MKKVAATHGGEYKGPCPFCGGRDRLSVHPDSLNRNGKYMGGRYICRQCGKYGDAVSYIMETSGKNFKEACLYLNIMPDTEREFMDSSRIKICPAWTPRLIHPPCDAWQSKAGVFVDYCMKILWDNAFYQIRLWLNRRGINDYSIEKAGLGWNPKQWFRERETWGLEPVTRENGKPKMLWLPAGLVIPCYSDRQVVRLRIRRPEKGMTSRYYIVPGSDSRPMIWENIFQTSWSIVESELDGILMAQEAGELISVAAMGSAQARPDKALHDALTNADSILVALDSEEKAGPREAWNFWKKTYRQFIRWPTPVGKDPGEMYEKGFKDIREWIKLGLKESHYTDNSRHQSISAKYSPLAI